MKNKEFYVVIERDEDGIYIGEVPQLKACYSQGETIDELMQNIKEVIEIKEMISKNMNQTKIASLYNVTPMNISLIKTGKNWGFVKENDSA